MSPCQNHCALRFLAVALPERNSAIAQAYATGCYSLKEVTQTVSLYYAATYANAPVAHVFNLTACRCTSSKAAIIANPAFLPRRTITATDTGWATH